MQTTSMRHSTPIPDGSVVLSSMQSKGAIQQIKVVDQELNPQLELAKKIPKEELIPGIADLTVTSLHCTPESNEEWNRKATDPDDYQNTLSECIEKGWINCFGRSIFMNVMLDRSGVECATVEGTVVDTQLPELPNNGYPRSWTNSELQDIDPTAKADDHCWNVAHANEEYHFVDTALTLGEKPIIQKMDYRNDPRGIKMSHGTVTVKLPDGRFRHYLPFSRVEVRTES